MMEILAITIFVALSMFALCGVRYGIAMFFNELKHKDKTGVALSIIVVFVMVGSVVLSVEWIVRIIKEGIT